jgi:CheY-like chemotaxis protein
VFLEFQRLDQGARVARGLGLGLSIVERIGRVLDHPITLTSQAGRGSAFKVEVPIVAALPASATPLESQRTPTTPLSGLRVLTIDNEPTILEGMRSLLTAWGCIVTSAPDLAGAVDGIVREPLPPEVIIADYHLDEGHGLDMIRALRSRLGMHVPAVLVTADRTPAVRDAAAAIGVHLLNKPVKPAALRALLAQWRASRAAAE